ncbi:hypothetical protein SLA_7009 [Streptomyces laurentii]|uniref:Uncharacterized protein n=1 Tax=Streptomyces laurentii TaxID=39478 RepID=A0A160P974_STRLU|nr:hypothetical protein SLA_7009 [Streptomyces laurentii]
MIQPDQDAPAWFASVAVLDEGGYEVVRREHDVTVETSNDRIAGDLTKWLAARASSNTAWRSDQCPASARMELGLLSVQLNPGGHVPFACQQFS